MEIKTIQQLEIGGQEDYSKIIIAIDDEGKTYRLAYWNGRELSWKEIELTEIK